MKKITYLCAFTLLFVTSIFAQSNAKTIERFYNKTKATISFNETNTTINFIKFPNQNPFESNGNSLKDKVSNFLDTNASLFKMPNGNAFVFDKQNTDSYGFNHLNYQQHYNGVPVFDAKLKFHFNKDGKITAINGNVIPNIKVNPIPTINSSSAKNKAIEVINKQNLNYSGTDLFIEQSKLVIYPKGLIQNKTIINHLAYYIEVRNNVDVREYVFIDAHTGNLIEQFTGIAHALDRVVYEGNTSTVVWQEGDVFPGDLTVWQQNEVETSGHMYYFFNNTFGYDSYNGSGAQMRTINNNPNVGNASWNGVTTNYRDGTASDDVIAHEWGHAYTEYTSGLIYAYQSGAINESYSDIWGETIDLLNNYQDEGEDLSLRTACQSSDRWRMGEDATFFSGPIRDLWDPTCNGHPGKLTDGQYWCAESDSGGVHVNSGIPNHAYALLVDGGSYNGQIIAGIGFTKAAHIFWRAQSVYLTSTSDFSDLADALEASANDLLGINLEGLSFTVIPSGLSGEIITPSDVNQLANALLAVELRTDNNCNFTPVLAEISPLCDSATANPIYFEDWESGMGNWVVNQTPSNPATWESRDWTISNTLPKGRAGSAVFGVDPINGNCGSDLQNGIITLESPVITLPDFSEGTYEMYFNHYVSTEANWDGGNIKYKINAVGDWMILPDTAFLENAYNSVLNSQAQGNDNPMESQPVFTGSDQGTTSGSWGTSVIDLSVLGVSANDSVQFKFDLGTDGCNGREGWYIDELAVYNCALALSVEEFANLDQTVSIYPNPSSGEFNIVKLKQVNLKQAQVYDINGRLINTIDLNTVNNETTLDITDAATGMYFITITAEDNAKTTFKVLKQ
ncbi:M4 family metallopeptidase [Lacinutrix salivirga]